MIEPGPVHTEFEMKMFADVSKKEYVGTDPETLHHFRTCYLPSAVNIFQGLGQSPEDIAKVRNHVRPVHTRNDRNNHEVLIIVLSLYNSKVHYN